MTGFAMSFENTPGRLNFLEGPGFNVLLDFVQNHACMEQLCAFTDQLNVKGKRILLMSVLGRHPDETVRTIARMASTSFDRFICRNYVKTFPHRRPAEIPEMLRDELIRCGVPAEHIAIELEETAATQRALQMASRGDLVVILCGIRPQAIWQQVTEFSSRAHPP
jgi:cyanophycin synthetase